MFAQSTDRLKDDEGDCEASLASLAPEIVNCRAMSAHERGPQQSGKMKLLVAVPQRWSIMAQVPKPKAPSIMMGMMTTAQRAAGSLGWTRRGDIATW